MKEFVKRITLEICRSIFGDKFMNFIDYVTLMLINMTAGYFLLSCFVWWGLDSQDKIHWTPAFAIVGLVATVCGFVMTFTWPLPKPYSMAFGEMSVLLGVLFLGAALALARGWNLQPLTIYAIVAGVAAIVLGVGIFKLGLTATPVLTGIGFVLSGLAGVLSPIVVWKSRQIELRAIASLVLLARRSEKITVYGAYRVRNGTGGAGRGR
jgi:putative membrane protein